jgi:putative flavoprotein involved in K+ transport
MDGSARARGRTKRTLRPRHIVLATGVSGIPNCPRFHRSRTFRGKVLHSSQYTDGESWKGANAIVIGTGNSGHDIAQDLYSSGANVTLVQRNPTLIVNIEPSAQLPYSLYDEGPPLEDCDLITMAMPLKLAWKSHQIFTERAKQLDQPLLDKLERLGFRLDFGEEGTGWQFKYLTRGGGYYFNVGCSIWLPRARSGWRSIRTSRRSSPTACECAAARRFPRNSRSLRPATRGQEALVRKLFGAQIADRVGPIWGFDEGQELRNMFMRCAQPGLWFHRGELRAMPDLFEGARAADQGAGRRIAAGGSEGDPQEC